MASIGTESRKTELTHRADASVPSVNTAGGCKSREHADPRVRRTRKLLQEAYRDLIHEKPYAEISVQHITERATVNRATFYAHYVDKQDLAVNVAKTDLTVSIYGMFSQRPQFSRENMVLFATAVFEFIGCIHEGHVQDAADLHAALAMGIQDELYSMTHGWLGHNSSIYTQMFPGSSRETLASVISSSLYGAAFRWVRAGKREPAAEVCREIVAVLVKR